MELEGRVALVTGASRGIGRAAALALGESGASVVLTARSEGEGERVAETIRARGGRAMFLRQDVTNEDDLRTVMGEIDRVHEGLNIFIANAGISFAKPLAEMSLLEFRALIGVNLRSAFMGLREAVKLIRKRGQGGSVILMSSIVGKIGAPGYTHYAAAKGGLRLMAKAAALELGPENIRVNSLHPGLVRTDLTKDMPEKMFTPLIPLGRFGEDREVAAAVVFLASDRSAFVTGAEIVLDGGMSVR